MLDEATTRLHRWRMRDRGSGGTRCHRCGGARQFLADDLDTPKAFAALDGWTTDALEYGGHDTQAPQTVATAIDSLLGVRL